MRKMLREAVAAYGLDTRRLNEIVRLGGQVRQALNDPNPPPEIAALLDILQALITPGERLQIKSPRDIGPLLMVQMGHLDQEHLKVICLNTKNYVALITTVYVGNVNTSIVRAAEIFRPAIATNAPTILIAHNHPSNDAQPSPEDVLLTRELCAAGRQLDIELIDHLIVCQDKFLSMRERGLGFSK
jgi:DNA repair protein RadC